MTWFCVLVLTPGLAAATAALWINATSDGCDSAPEAPNPSLIISPLGLLVALVKLFGAATGQPKARISTQVVVAVLTTVAGFVMGRQRLLRRVAKRGASACARRDAGSSTISVRAFS